MERIENELIHIGKPIEFNEEKFRKQLAELEVLAKERRVPVRKT